MESRNPKTTKTHRRPQLKYGVFYNPIDLEEIVDCQSYRYHVIFRTLKGIFIFPKRMINVEDKINRFNELIDSIKVYNKIYCYFDVRNFNNEKKDCRLVNQIGGGETKHPILSSEFDKINEENTTIMLNVAKMKAIRNNTEQLQYPLDWVGKNKVNANAVGFTLAYMGVPLKDTHIDIREIYIQRNQIEGINNVVEVTYHQLNANKEVVHTKVIFFPYDEFFEQYQTCAKILQDGYSIH